MSMKCELFFFILDAKGDYYTTGVLIAVKNSLNLHPKLITSTAKAEIISIELTLPNKKRLTVSTLYRVGTLGNFNAKEVATHFTKIFNSKKYKYNFIVGI